MTESDLDIFTSYQIMRRSCDFSCTCYFRNIFSEQKIIVKSWQNWLPVQIWMGAVNSLFVKMIKNGLNFLTIFDRFILFKVKVKTFWLNRNRLQRKRRRRKIIKHYFNKKVVMVMGLGGWKRIRMGSGGEYVKYLYTWNFLRHLNDINSPPPVPLFNKFYEKLDSIK